MEGKETKLRETKQIQREKKERKPKILKESERIERNPEGTKKRAEIKDIQRE